MKTEINHLYYYLLILPFPSLPLRGRYKHASFPFLSLVSAKHCFYFKYVLSILILTTHMNDQY